MKEEFTRTPSPEEIAYCAGLFEGEGCALAINLKGGGKTPIITIAMTDREPLERMAIYMGGTLGGYALKPRKEGYKVRYQWRTQSWRDFIRVSEWIRPWLSPRRLAQIDKVLELQPAVLRGTATCPTTVIPVSAGWQRHKRLGEPPCEMCVLSKNLYQLTMREAAKAAGRTRTRHEAQQARRAREREQKMASSKDG